MERRHAYRLIHAADVVENVSNWTHELPATESQARPLTALAPDQQRAAWEQAVATAPPDGITAATPAALEGHGVANVCYARAPEPGGDQMAGEEAARRTIELALGRPVALHDDNKRPSMYDLRIGPADAPDLAVEVTAAVDAEYTETWNAGPAKGSMTLRLKRSWTVVIASGARVRTIRKRLEPLLMELEARGLHHLRADHLLRRADERLFDTFVALGIEHAWCSKEAGAGRVYLMMDGAGGAVDESGAALPPWIGEFLRDPKQADVLRKLAASGAPRREAFIIAALRGTPWPVEGYLMRDLDQLPPIAPDLPDPVTGVWVVSSFAFSGRGVRWDGTAWHFFNADDEAR